MQNLIFSANAVLPVFLVMLIGWILKNTKAIPDGFWDGVSKYVFIVATPLLLFEDTSSVDFKKSFDVKYISIVLACFFLSVAIFWIFYPMIQKDKKKIGALIHCSFRSNFAILGLPLLKNMLSPEGIVKAEALLAVGIIVFNGVAVFCLAYWSESKGDYKKVFMNIVKNPLIIGCVIGLLFSALKVPTPVFLDRTVSYIGNTALGLGLLLLGGAFDIKKFCSYFKESILATFAKIVFSPLLAVVILYVLGYRGDELLIALVYMGSSTAVNSYVMAKEMKSDADLTSGIVVCTTGLSVITLFLGIFIIKML